MRFETVIYIEDLPEECIRECSSIGDVSEYVTHWRKKLGLEVNQANARKGLLESGGWDEKEVAAMSDEDVTDCVLWLACCAFGELLTWRERHPGRDDEEANAGSSLYVLDGV